MLKFLLVGITLQATHAFAPQLRLRISFTSTTLHAGPPAALLEYGCDDALWASIPPGAVRDLSRYARDGQDEMMRQRIVTMREVMEFSDAAPGAFDRSSWDRAVQSWEAEEARKEAEEKAVLKAAKGAAAKAMREAKAAAEAAS